MAKVFLFLKSCALAKSNSKHISLLDSFDIPFETNNNKIYLLCKEAYISGINVKSREYSKPFSKFAMQLSDSAKGGFIGMGEDCLDQDILSVMHKVFGDSLSFEFRLSCNNEEVFKTSNIVLNKKTNVFEFLTKSEVSSDLEDEEIYIKCDRCAKLYLINSQCDCISTETLIVEPPTNYRNDVLKIREICRLMNDKEIAFREWNDFVISNGYKSVKNLTNIEIPLGKMIFFITNKNNELPKEINFIEGKFAGWLGKK